MIAPLFISVWLIVNYLISWFFLLIWNNYYDSYVAWVCITAAYKGKQLFLFCDKISVY